MRQQGGFDILVKAALPCYEVLHMTEKVTSLCSKVRPPEDLLMCDKEVIEV